MNILASMLLSEKKRNENMILEYRRELVTLPKGSIKAKKLSDKVYYYLTFRDGNKVITKYIGKDESLLIPIREQLERRKQVESIIKKLNEEKMKIIKMEAVL